MPVFQSPVLGVFLCFLFEFDGAGNNRIISIPSFRGFSLFRCTKCGTCIPSKPRFQSPVLGVFLCFQSSLYAVFDVNHISIPSFRGFSLFRMQHGKAAR